MSILERIKAALAPLNIPVTAYEGDTRKPVYAVVYDLLEQPELRTDDRETLTGNHVQIDFIAKKNIEALVRQATDLLADAGFVRRGKSTEYEPVTKTYRHMLRVFYIQEYGEE